VTKLVIFKTKFFFYRIDSSSDSDSNRQWFIECFYRGYLCNVERRL